MLRVFIVEDEIPHARHLARLVEGSGVEARVVDTARDGRAALESAALGTADLAICDVRMPVMDGLSFAAELKVRAPHIQIAFLTAYKDFEYARRAIALESLEYLLKPVDRGELEAMLKKAEQRLSRSSADEAGRCAVALLSGAEPESLGADAEGMAALRTHAPFFVVAEKPAGGAKTYAEGCSLLGRIAEGNGAVGLELVGTGGKKVESLLLSPVNAGQDRCVVVVGPAQEARIVPPSVGRALELIKNVVPFGAPGVYMEGGAWQARRAPTPDDLSTHAEDLALTIRGGEATAVAERTGQLVRRWRRLAPPAATLAVALVRLGLRVADSLAFNLPDEGKNLTETLAALPDRCADWEDLERRLARRLLLAAEADGSTPGKSVLIERAAAYMTERYADPITVQDLAYRAGVSPQHLVRLFRRDLGMSPLKYLIAQRMESAKRLLLEYPDLPIREVAAAVGYDDPLYFSRLFSRKTGMYPSDFRAKDGEAPR